MVALLLLLINPPFAPPLYLVVESPLPALSPISSGDSVPDVHPQREAIAWMIGREKNRNAEVAVALCVRIATEIEPSIDVKLIGPCDLIRSSYWAVAIGRLDEFPFVAIVRFNQLQHHISNASGSP